MCLVIFAPIFAICAFATCGGYNGHIQVKVDCADRRQRNLSINIEFAYPFRLQEVHFKAPLCGTNGQEILFLDGDFSTAARVFLTVGVFAFLYSLLATVVYVFYQNKCNSGPLVDLVITVVFSSMWLISSCCWAKTLADIKMATHPTQVILLISACSAQDNKCTATQEALWSNLNTSVIFGFVNVILWAGNIWFVLKETGWSGQRYPTRRASGKRASEMQQGLYSESGFDQPEGGFSPHPSRQNRVSQSKGDLGQQVHSHVSSDATQLTLSLPHAHLGNPVFHDRENKVASQGPVIFVNEM